MTTDEQINALANYLRVCTENKTLFIRVANKNKKAKFFIAEPTLYGVKPITTVMTYDEMNCYFNGVMAVKNNKI